MKFLAFDTETELIADRASLSLHQGEGRTGRIHTEPYKVPDIVLGTTGEGNLFSPEGLVSLLRTVLCNGDHVVGHNLAFDIGVVCKHDPGLYPLFLEAAEQGRLHDTMILDQLYGLATGRYDKPKYDPANEKWSVADLRPRSLDVLAWEYCGLKLNKDDSIRLGFGAYKGRLDKLPSDFRQYALQDAQATYAVFEELKYRLEKMGAKNWLSEASQIRAQLVCADMDERGVCIDQKLAERLRVLFQRDVGPLCEKLVADGLGRWEPVPKTRRTPTSWPGNVPISQTWVLDGGRILRESRSKAGKIKWESAQPKFCLDTKALRAALSKVPLTEKIPTTEKTALLSMDAKWWAQRLPPGPGPLRNWLAYEKLQKILSTYLNVYSRATKIFPRWWILGARSGRMSASKPSIQNVPKRKYGIRALFVPPLGKVFTKADYTAQEMYTLCEVMLNMGIKGPLYDALTGPVDIHRYGAGLVLGKRPEDVTKDERQGQKALHFGVPGGLGPVTLASYAFDNYGVLWTPEQAKDARKRFLDVFKDIDEYLSANKRSQDAILRTLTGMGRRGWAEQLALEDGAWNVIRAMAQHTNPDVRKIGIDAERCLTIELPTGLRRACCTFTEGANCGFQGLAAAVTKHAAWLAYRAGLEIVMIVHDEILVEHCIDDQSPVTLEECMLQAFRELCPLMGPFAKVEVSACISKWGPATDALGEVI